MSNDDKKLTSEQFTELERLDKAEDRTGFYIKYNEYTGVDQALEMAQISSFSGALGGIAEAANIFIQNDYPDLYPKEGVIALSRKIQSKIFDAVKTSYNDPKKGGVLSGLEMVEIAGEVWKKHKLAEQFPGGIEIALEKLFDSKYAESRKDGNWVKNLKEDLGKVFSEGTVYDIKGAYEYYTTNDYGRKLSEFEGSSLYKKHLSSDFSSIYFTDEKTGMHVYVEESGVQKVGNSYLIEGGNIGEIAKRLDLSVDRLEEHHITDIDVFGRAITKRSYVISPEKPQIAYEKFYIAQEFSSWEHELTEERHTPLDKFNKGYTAISYSETQEYQVKEGDTLWWIAKSYGSSVDEILNIPGNSHLLSNRYIDKLGRDNIKLDIDDRVLVPLDKSFNPTSKEWWVGSMNAYFAQAKSKPSFLTHNFENGNFRDLHDFQGKVVFGHLNWQAKMSSFKDDHNAIIDNFKQEYDRQFSKYQVGWTKALSEWKTPNNDLDYSNFEIPVTKDYPKEIGGSSAKMQKSNWNHINYERYETPKTSKEGGGVNWSVLAKVAGAAVSIMFGYSIPLPILPIAIDLKGDGIDFIDISSSTALYDFTGDGLRELTAWVGVEDALLAIDYNHDGMISEPKELSFKLWSEKAKSDLEGLKEFFDSNQDGKFDKDDTRFNEFFVWQDINQDGISNIDELKTLSEVGIKSIVLNDPVSFNDWKINKKSNVIVKNAAKIIWDDKNNSETKAEAEAEGLAYDIGLEYADGVSGYSEDHEMGTIKRTNGEEISVFKSDRNEEVSLKLNEIGFNAAFGGKLNDFFNGSGKLGVIVDAKEGNDTMIGSDKGDWLKGGMGKDEYKAGLGHDILIIDEEDKNIDGGEGFDIAISNAISRYITIDLEESNLEGYVSNSPGISKSRHNSNSKEVLGDYITAKSAKNGVVIIGGDGDDYLESGDGNDFVVGGYGKDRIKTNNGNDTVIIDPLDIENPYSIQKYSMEGIDTGEGFDTISIAGGWYMSDSKALIFDVSNVNVERVLGNYNNKIIYNGNKDMIIAAGNIKSGKGNDVLIPLGNTNIEGGGGSDVYLIGSDIDHINILNKENNGNGMNAILLHSSIKQEDIYFSFNEFHYALEISSYTKKLSFQLLVSNWLKGKKYQNYEFILNGEDKTIAKRLVVKAQNCELSLKKYLPCSEDFRLENSNEWTVFTADGNDKVGGGDKNDFIHSGGGNDQVIGWEGDDVLNGGKGNDILKGWKGNDTYIYHKGEGNDIILDDYQYYIDNIKKEGNAGTDTIYFGYGIHPNQIVLTTNDIRIINNYEVAKGDLLIKVYQEQNSDITESYLVVQKWKNTYNKVEYLKFEEGGLSFDISSCTDFNNIHLDKLASC